MLPRPPKSLPRSLARAVGSLPPPPRIARPKHVVFPAAPHSAHPHEARAPFSQPRLVVGPHPAPFAPTRLVGGVPSRRTMPATVAGRLGAITAGMAARLGGFRRGRR